MSQTAYSAFLPEVTVHCNGVPDLISINALRNATIEFLERSHWLESTLAPIDGVANQATYVIPPPTGTEIVRMQAVFYDNLPLHARSEEQIRKIYSLDWRTMSGWPRFYLRDPDDYTQITLAPYPEVSESGALTGIAVLRPTRTSTGVDSSVYEKWLEQIAAGAVARLLSTPGQSYTNPRAAQMFMGKFNSGIADARIDRNKGLERATNRVVPPKFI